MNRVITIAILLILGSLGVRLLVSKLVSDETKIRWMLEDMVEGFDEGDSGDTVSGLARTWTHAGRPIDRDMIKGYVFREWMESSRSSSGQYPWDVEIPEDSLTISVAADGETATIELEAVFSELEGGGDAAAVWKPNWHVRIWGDLENTDDGWRIVKSRHEDIQGVMLGR